MLSLGGPTLKKEKKKKKYLKSFTNLKPCSTAVTNYLVPTS
jgi:hypothetical protein